MEATQITATHGRDTYGHFVMFGGPWRAAMPDMETAKLVAASPKLLEACIAALSALECNPEFRRNEPTIDTLRKAINRATA